MILLALLIACGGGDATPDGAADATADGSGSGSGSAAVAEIPMPTEAPVPARDLRLGYRYVDGAGTVVIEGPFSMAQEFSEERAWAVPKGERGYVMLNYRGDVLHATSWQQTGPFRDGLARVASTGGAWGYVDPDNQVVIDFQFVGATDFENGVAAVGTPDGWGAVDVGGRWVIQPTFAGMGAFSGGRAPVLSDDDDSDVWYFVDVTGARVELGDTKVVPAFTAPPDDCKDMFAYAEGIGAVTDMLTINVDGSREIRVQRFKGGIEYNDDRDSEGRTQTWWLPGHTDAQANDLFNACFNSEEVEVSMPSGGALITISGA